MGNRVMKTTLIVIQNDADHVQAKGLIETLMNSKDPADQAQMMAQAYLTEAYERARWPRRAPSLPGLLTYLTDQHEHELKVTALRQALIDGENSGEADELDLGKIKAKARQRPSS